MNIVFAGFMGSGKTAVGNAVADKLDRPFFETDKLVVKRINKPIAEIFEDDGEVYFRYLELVICRELVHEDGKVISLGGGTIMNEYIRQMLAMNGMLINLHTDLEEIFQRVPFNPDRPLFSEREKVRALYEKRLPVYRSLPFQVDTTGKTIDQVSDEVIALWRQHNY